MALQELLVPVELKGGQDNKSSPNSIPIGKLALLQNCVRRKTGRIDKRYGFDELSTDTVDGDTLTSGKRLFAYSNELGLISSGGIYSYSPALAKWAFRGDWVVPLARNTFSFSNAYDQALYDFATWDGASCYVWVDRKLSSVSIRCAVVDNTTGAILLHDTEVSSSGDMPKVIALNGYFIIYYSRGGTLYSRRITKDSPTGLSAEIAINNTINNIYDVVAWNSSYGVLALATTANTIRLMFVGETGASNPATFPSDIAIATRGDSALTVEARADENKIFVGYSSTGGAEANTTRCRIFDGTTFTEMYNISFAAVASRNITIAAKTGEAAIFFEVAAAASYNHYVESWRFTTTATANSDVVTRSVGLATKAFVYNDNYYVTLAHDSSLQSTYFLRDHLGCICGKFLYGRGGGLTRANTSGATFTRALHSGLSRVVADSTDEFSLLLQSATQLLAADDGTTFSENYNIRRYTIDFDNPYESAELGDATYIAGALVGQYDGVSAVEAGFNLYPENLTASAAGAGSGLTAGTYYWAAVYEWVNARGEREQSAPSILDSTSVGAAQELTVVVPTLRVTRKQAEYNRADVKIVLYRSQVDDPVVLYRDVVAKNDPTLDTVSLISTATDATIATKEILYTVGGELENVGAPACTAITRHGGRLFLIGLEDGNTVAFSKDQRTGDAARFSADFVLNVEARGGPCHAAASLDDKLILFKKDRLYSLAGNGPTANGQFYDYLPPKVLATDVGTDNPASLVLTPLGLMFQSDKGIYVLDRGETTRYIGDRMEDSNSLRVTSAAVLEDTNEVRFTTSGVCMVYNYYFDEWSVFSNYSAASAVSHSILGYCHLKSTGEVRVESTSYLDAGQRIAMTIETGWLPFAGVLGFQRIWNVYCMGEFVSHHHTRVKLAYNRENVFNETKYFDTRDALSTSTFGDDGPFGTGGFGTGSLAYEWQLKPRRQKCESIKIRIEDVDTITTGGGGSVSLNALMFEVGVKGTGTKATPDREI